MPATAMIHGAEEFEKAAHAAAGKTPCGLTAAAPVEKAAGALDEVAAE